MKKRTKEKKIREKKGWNRSRLLVPIICLAVILCAALGAIGYRCAGQRAENDKNVYLAIRFLHSGNEEAASNYLDSMYGMASKKTRFVSDAARILKEKLSGNNTIARIKLDLLDREYARNKEQEDAFAYLSADDIKKGADISSICTVLVDLMNISDKKKERYEAQYQIQSNSVNGGWVSEEDLAEYEKLCGNGSGDSLRISAALTTGDYNTALAVAARMVKESPNDKNRLLFADIIAQASYSGLSVPGYLFYEDAENDFEEKEWKALEKQIDKLAGQQEKLQARYDVAKSDAEKQKIGEEKVSLYEQQDGLQRKHDNIYAYRALNSVADIRSLDARIIRSKLYYAVGEEERAVQELLDAADSLSARLSMNEVKQEGLKLVKEAYAGTMDTAIAYHEATKAMLKSLLGTSSSEVLTMNVSGLAEDFSNKLVADIKYQNNGIYVTELNDSAYPEIRLTINARKEIIEDIVNHNNIISKDTHHEVAYTAEAQLNSASTICFVVDVSGSMEGAPIRNAKNALKSFAKTLDAGTEVALVTFNSGAEIVTEVTADTSQMLNAVDEIGAGGGTDITMGIESATLAFADASYKRCMILMTDGQSNIDYHIVDQAAEQGIVIFTIGFGDVNQQMLEEIADRTGGQFTLADSSGELSSVYNSIGSMLGNQVDLTYTVTEEMDAVPRYFFIRANNFDSSKRHTYRNSAKENAADMADSFYIKEVEGAMPVSAMKDYAEQGKKWTLRFTSSDDKQVDSITVNGEQVQAREGSGCLEAELKPLETVGLYDLEVTLTDGSVYTANDVILVYDDQTEGASQRNVKFRLGVLHIQTDLAAYLPGGRLVISGADFYDGDQPYGGTLYAYTNNLVIFPEYVRSETANDNGELPLGDSGSFYMNGSCYLGEQDAQSVHGMEMLCFYGKVSAKVDVTQCTITREEE